MINLHLGAPPKCLGPYTLCVLSVWGAAALVMIVVVVAAVDGGGAGDGSVMVGVMGVVEEEVVKVLEVVEL